MDRRFFAKTALGLVAGTVGLSAAPSGSGVKKMQTNFKKDNSRFATNADEDEVKVIQSKRFYKQPSKKAQGKCTSILFFADVHLVVGNLLKIKDFAQKHKKYIDDVVHLGDAVGNVYKGNFALWDNYPNALNIIGNHDVYDGSYKKILSDKSKYSIYFEKYIKSWNVVQPEDAQANGICYFYKDYNDDVRLIAIDCMNPNNAQFDWFVKALSGARKAGLKVVIATHIPPTGDAGLDCNFNSIDYAFEHASTEASGKNFTRFVDAVDEFISQGGGFVAWICGHSHHDRFMHATGTKYKQLIVVMECATDFDYWTDADHVRDTPTGTCWEIISIESVSNVLKIARFGNNFDHYLRHKGTLCYDFKNHKLISQY